MRNVLLATLLILLYAHGDAQTFSAVLSGNHQPLPVFSRGYGSVSATLNGDTLSVSGDFQDILSGVDTSILGGAHIHMGLAGQNGGVQYALRPTLSEGLNAGMFEVATNTFILSDDTKNALRIVGSM